jgi:hypothetical protein
VVRIISGGLGKLVGPSVDDGMAIDVVDAGHDALLEFVHSRRRRWQSRSQALEAGPPCLSSPDRMGVRLTRCIAASFPRFSRTGWFPSTQTVPALQASSASRWKRANTVGESAGAVLHSRKVEAAARKPSSAASTSHRPAERPLRPVRRRELLRMPKEPREMGG